MRVRGVPHPEDTDGTMKAIAGDGLKDSGPRHAQLPPELQARADKLLDRIGKYLGHTEQSWRDGFCRDMHPDRQIKLWERIADVEDYLWVKQAH